MRGMDLNVAMARRTGPARSGNIAGQGTLP
ncbi:hypothetical protein RTBOTA2_004857 [Rhodotorula toruloides]|nr:hypothetical protein RTBOTA2_004857 [Rhodotorula toruloides]